jgi:uncharacterized membrane protein
MNFTETFVKVAVTVSDRLNPITSGPAGPLKASAALDSFGPSLMPRTSVHQGIAAGLTVLAAEAIGLSVDVVARSVAPKSSPLAWRVGARAAIAAGGAALSRIQEAEDEPTSKAMLRSAGQVVSVAAIGGIIHEAGNEVQGKIDTPIVPIVTGLGGFGYMASRWGKELETRKAVIQRWTEDDKPAQLPMSITIAIALAFAGRWVGRGYLSSRNSLTGYVGEGPGHSAIGRVINGGLWGVGAVTLYGSLVRRISRANAKMETNFSVPPSNEYVSGGPNSVSPFEELGLQGRRYVTEVVTPDAIEETLGEPSKAHPIRVYVGVDSEPIYATGRSELALNEMERLGVFDRDYLLLVSPTGTGWVDHTMIESAELFARGDIATVCIQYGKAPSFLEVQGVSLGRAQFRQLLWGVRQRLRTVDEKKRPKVLVFGESLGAWSSSDVIMHQGIEGFDHYGISKALWFGLPGLARWSKAGMREGRNRLTPEGTVAAFDNFEQYEALSATERETLRAIVVDHDNDPIATMSLRLAVKKPSWLDGERGRNVPEQMKWTPIISFIQVLIDAMNAMVTVPGEFKSFGHDYRADTADFVQAAYGLPSATDEQRQAIHNTLIAREVDRAARIKAEEPGLIENPLQQVGEVVQ